MCSKYEPSVESINKYIQEITNINENQNPNENQKPTAILMVGISGAGKSVAQLQMIKETESSNFVRIDPDDILQHFFDLDENCRNYVENMVMSVLTNTIQIKKNIIFDRTGRDINNYNIIIDMLKKEGYTIYICIVLNTLNQIKINIDERKKKTGRGVNFEYLNKALGVIHENIPKYIDLPCEKVNGVYVYNNSNNTTKLIYSSSCNKQIKNKICNNICNNQEEKEIYKNIGFNCSICDKTNGGKRKSRKSRRKINKKSRKRYLVDNRR
jgi:predicted ABC-type ATPase